MANQLIVHATVGTKALTCSLPDGTVVFQSELDFKPRCVATSGAITAAGGAMNFGSPDCLLCVFDLDLGTRISMPISSLPDSIAFSHSEGKFACGLQDGTVIILSWCDAQCTKMYQWKAAETSIYALIWLGDDVLCTGSGDGVLSMWDCSVSDSRFRTQLLAGGGILCLAVPSDSSDILLSGQLYGIVRRWHLPSGSFAEFKVHQGGVRGLCISDDNTLAITCSDDKTVAASNILTFSQHWRHQCVEKATSIGLIGNEVFVAVCDSPLLVLDVCSGTPLRQFSRTHPGWGYIAIDHGLGRLKFAD